MGYKTSVEIEVEVNPELVLDQLSADDILEYLSKFHDEDLVAFVANDFSSEALDKIGEKECRSHFGLEDEE